jgi:hypothetical protein
MLPLDGIAASCRRTPLRVTHLSAFARYASPERIFEKVIQCLPHGEQIAAALGSKPLAPNKRVDLTLTELDR